MGPFSELLGSKSEFWSEKVEKWKTSIFDSIHSTSERSGTSGRPRKSKKELPEGDFFAICFLIEKSSMLGSKKGPKSAPKRGPILGAKWLGDESPLSIIREGLFRVGGSFGGI